MTERAGVTERAGITGRAGMTEREGRERWLAAQARPGRAGFACAAAALSVRGLADIGGSVGIALAASGVLLAAPATALRGVIVFAAAAVLRTASGYTAERFRTQGADRVGARLRTRVAATIFPSAPRSVDVTAAVAAVAMVDLVDDVADYHGAVLPLRWSAPIVMTAVFGLTAVVHWPAALVLAVSTALIPLNLQLAGLFARDGADAQRRDTERLAAVVLDSFAGLGTLVQLRATTRRERTIAAAADALARATLVVLRRAFLSGLIMDVVITFSIAVNATYIGMALLGYVEIPGAPRLTLFSGLLILLVCPMYFAPLRAFAAAFHDREHALSAATVLLPLSEAEPVDEVAAARPARGVPPAIVFDQTVFGYPDASEDLLRVGRVIRAGAWTAVTGPSGAGKSTLLSLIAGMRTPTAGSLRWDFDGAERAPRLGDAVWVGQDTAVVAGSVRDNLLLADAGATSRELWTALTTARLADAVAALPEGLDAPLGQDGFGLSTGEIRRLAVARAVLKDAPVWLLDEPTAHLDPDTEAGVIEALRRATAGRTVVVATHSPAVAAAAQDVLAIEDGTLEDLTPVRA